MKIIHVTDPHLASELVYGMDSRANFKSCLDHIKMNHSDADGLVITGDLAHSGERSAYNYLADLIRELPFPTWLLVGNHDVRETFKSVFPEITTFNGFVQYEIELGSYHCLFLDTIKTNHSSGELCSYRVKWLSERLEDARRCNKKVVIFMHHNPIDVHVHSSDSVGLETMNAFHQLVQKYREHLYYIFFGHCHQSLSGSLYGIPFASIKGTNHQVLPDFSEERRFKLSDSQPVYNVIFLNTPATVIHTVEYRKIHFDVVGEKY